MADTPRDPLTEDERLAFIRERVADNPGGFTDDFRFLLATLDAARAPRNDGDGTTTDCPQEGVHDHPFRGPHRFTEWYDAALAAHDTPEEAR